MDSLRVIPMKTTHKASCCVQLWCTIVVLNGKNETLYYMAFTHVFSDYVF